MGERIKQLEVEKSKIEMEMARVSHEATSLRSELERRPPLRHRPGHDKGVNLFFFWRGRRSVGMRVSTPSDRQPASAGKKFRGEKGQAGPQT